ncbi:MAG TPA: LEA type 2 family protein [Gemmatimonadales bacterium]|nr:LEA type 2 family protein [Gemmatimonadales bacterium]
MALGVGMLATACAGLREVFREPRIDLQRVVVRGLGVTGGDLDLIVRVANPNGFALHGTRLEAGFDVEGSHVGTVTYQDEYQIRRNDSTLVTLPVRFEWSGVGSAFRAALRYGDIPYTLKGQATLRTPIGPRVVAFTTQGRAPLVRSGGGLPGPAPGSP